MFPTYPDLEGRTALVTGASSGIGRGIAQALLQQGVRVCAQHRTQSPPPGTVAVQAELGRERGCVDAVRKAHEKLGKINLLVHAALWLSSDASSHCIGQDLCVSGGALLVVPRGQVRPV